VPALQALVSSAHTVVGVLTQPDRPKGRGQQLSASPVKAAALAAGLPVAQPLTLKTDEGRQPLVAWKPDVLVVVAYGLILPLAALAIPRLGCVNIHASLLPRWRGAAPIQRAILAGDAESGITIMQMDAGLDTGPMLLRRVVPIRPDETGGSLHDRLAAEGASAILEALDRLADGTAVAERQPEAGVTYAAKLDKAEARIDWTGSAVEIERQVRAFSPWPIAETRYEGEQLRVLAAKAQPAVEASAKVTAEAKADTKALAVDSALPDGQPPGTILSTSECGVLVQCGAGRLALTGVQRPGKRPVSARDFANQAPLVGRRLG